MVKAPTMTWSGKELSKMDVAQDWANNIQYQHAAFCCGITEIGEFGGELYSDIPPVTYATALRERLNDNREDREDGRIETVAIASLATTQLKHLRPVLELCGFEEVSNFVNRNTRNKVHIFIAKRGKNGKF